MASQAPPKKILPNPSQVLPPQMSAKPSFKANSTSTQRQVLRVNRACSACRKQKMRCDGPESPPCSRCKASGIPCVFEKVTKPDAEGTAQRLESLESRFTEMQGTMYQILHQLQSGARASDGPLSVTPQQHNNNHNNHNVGLLPFNPDVRNSYSPIPSFHRPPSESLIPGVEDYSSVTSNPLHSRDRGSPSSAPLHHSNNGALPPFQSLLPNPTHSSGRFRALDYSRPNSSLGPPTSSLRSSSSPYYTLGLANSTMERRDEDFPPRPPSPSNNKLRQYTMRGEVSSSYHSSRTDGPPTMLPPLDSASGGYGTSSGPPITKFDRRNINIKNLAHSALTSAANSDDEGDIPTEALVRPIHVLDALASASPLDRGDASVDDSHQYNQLSSPSTSSVQTTSVRSRKRKRGSMSSRSRTTEDITSPIHGVGSEIGIGGDGLRKYPRQMSTDGLSGTAELDPGYLSSNIETNMTQGQSGLGVGASPGTTVSDGDSEDVVAKGLISEDDARSLYELYFTGCYRLLACFSPKTDTYESMRRRSPFCFCAILLVAAKVRDGGGPKSQTQARLEKECIRMARNTMYPFGGIDDDHSGSVTLESVQAMLLLAGWSHSTSGAGWLIAGHAIRCAVQLGVHKALPRLERRKQRGKPIVDMSESTGEDPSVVSAINDVDPKDDKALIRSARTWCALYVFEAQVSFGAGRPAMMKADKSIINAREILLEHPLSTATDTRVISTCELLTLQGKINEALGPLDAPVDTETFDTIRNATASIDGWLNEWDAIMGRDHPAGDFFRASAAIQRSYALLFTRAVALRQLKTTADAQEISPEMKELVLGAIGNAQDCVELCVNNIEYREGLRYAVAYTHTCAAFAGAFLLRFARLFPDEMDVQKVIDLVQELAQLLSQVPAGRFSRALTSMLNHTRARLRSKTSEKSENLHASATAQPNDSHELSGVESSDLLQHGALHASASYQTSFLPGDLLGAQGAQDIQGTMPTNIFSAPFADGAPFPDIAPSDLQGFLGDGDWAPWLRNSMFGDLQPLTDNVPPNIDFVPNLSWDL